MHRNELSSSQYDRAIISNILNISTQHISDANISFIMDSIGSMTQHKHLSNEQIKILMISHLSILMKDISSEFCHLLQLMASHDGNKFMFELIISIIKMEIPIIGEFKMVYEILHMFIHIFDKHYIENLTIQGRSIPISITQSIHNFHHVYTAETHDDIFEIDVKTKDHRHSDTAKNEASAEYMKQMKDNAFYTTGLPYELMFPDNDFNHPHGMYRTYKNMRLCDRFLHAYINFNNLTPEEAYFYMAYMKHGSAVGTDSWWNLHKDEDPLSFIINWFRFHNSSPKSEEDATNHWESGVKERNKHRSGKDKQKSKDFEHSERGNYDHNKKEYSRIGVTLYANFKLLQNDISVGNLFDTGISSLHSMEYNTIAYLDHELRHIKNTNMNNYLRMKLNGLWNTYKQVWLTGVLSNHLTTTLCIIIQVVITFKGSVLIYFRAMFLLYLVCLFLICISVIKRNCRNI